MKNITISKMDTTNKTCHLKYFLIYKKVVYERAHHRLKKEHKINYDANST